MKASRIEFLEKHIATLEDLYCPNLAHNDEVEAYRQYALAFDLDHAKSEIVELLEKEIKTWRGGTNQMLDSQGEPDYHTEANEKYISELENKLKKFQV